VATRNTRPAIASSGSIRATNAVRVTISCSAIKAFEELDIASSATRLVTASSIAVSITSSALEASKRTINAWPPELPGLLSIAAIPAGPPTLLRIH